MSRAARPNACLLKRYNGTWLKIDFYKVMHKPVRNSDIMRSILSETSKLSIDDLLGEGRKSEGGCKARMIKIVGEDSSSSLLFPSRELCDRSAPLKDYLKGADSIRREKLSPGKVRPTLLTTSAMKGLDTAKVS